MFHFIYNPVAGKGKSARFRQELGQLLRATGTEHAFHETHHPREAIGIARKLTRGKGEGCLDIVAMGGDGTLNEVLNGLDDPGRVRLGIVPSGSGNDFATAAGIPDDPQGALDVLLNSEAKYTDYLVCGDVRGINAIGTGIDVDILRRYGRMKLLKGSAAYLASLVMSLFSYRPYSFREITAEGERSHNAFIACAGNGRHIGGGIPICPEAKVDDGLMDIVIVDDISRLKIPAAFIKLLKRKILEHPSTSFRRGSRLRLASDSPMPIQIDGEIYEGLPFDVCIVSSELRVFRP